MEPGVVGAVRLTDAKGVLTCAVAALTKDNSINPDIGWDIVVYEFIDNRQFCNLESVLLALQLSTVFVTKKGVPANLVGCLEECVSAASAALEECESKLFDAKDVEDELKHIIGASFIAPPGLAGQLLAREALAALIRVSKATSDKNICEHCHLTLRTPEDFMRLDAAAVEALHLISKPKSRGLNSLHAILSQGCSSKLGPVLLRQWILQPLRSIEAIQARQRIVSTLVEDPPLLDRLGDVMKIPDIATILSRLYRHKGTLPDLVNLFMFVKSIPCIREVLSSEEEGTENVFTKSFTTPLARLEGDLSRYLALIERIFDFAEFEKRGRYRINPSYCESLQDLSDEINNLDEEIAAVFSRVQSSKWGKGIDIKLDEDKQRGYVFRTARKNNPTVRKAPCAQVYTVLKGGVVFTTLGKDGLEPLAKARKEAQKNYDAEQSEMVKKAMDIAVSYLPVFEAVRCILSELDAFRGMAFLAMTAPGEKYCCPTLTATPALSVRRARHPVLEFADGVSFIANDYDMTRGECQFQIVTGPNMGGKSTFIRQLGCIAVLAQMGSFIPAESATLPLFDAVLARVGASDFLHRGVSTFLTEMLESSAILSSATKDSLVLVDELGRGTSTYDGFGLAWSISEHLSQLQCYCLFATHYHELTELSSAKCGAVGVVNKHVTASATAGALTMTYIVKDGACPASFGVHVAELANFPKSTIDVGVVDGYFADALQEARVKARMLEWLARAGTGSSDMMDIDDDDEFHEGSEDEATVTSPTSRKPVQNADVESFLRKAGVPVGSIRKGQTWDVEELLRKLDCSPTVTAEECDRLLKVIGEDG